MKKLISLFVILLITSCSIVPQSHRVEQTDPGFVLWDVLFYRPMGLIATVIGTGVFIGVSPLTAFASIPEPHDAFAKMSSILILSPATYTFIRPIGDRTFPYHVPPYKHKRIATHKNVVMPRQSPVSPKVPDVPPPQGYPDAGKGL